MTKQEKIEAQEHKPAPRSLRCVFFDTMAKRREQAKNSAERAYLTRAARKYVWMMRGIPTLHWAEMEAMHND